MVSELLTVSLTEHSDLNPGLKLRRQIFSQRSSNIFPFDQLSHNMFITIDLENLNFWSSVSCMVLLSFNNV